MSELALGWCTYNADHMSMYNPNVSIPKTLVKFLVRYAACNEFEEGPVRRTLLSIVETPVSPELLPWRAGAALARPTSLHARTPARERAHPADPARGRRRGLGRLAGHRHPPLRWGRAADDRSRAW